MRRPGPRSLARLLHQWRQAVLFRRASAALRAQSAALKKQFYQEQIRLASEADARGDQRAIFQIIKRPGPRTGRCASRLLTDAGTPMTAQQQIDAIVAHSKVAFATLEDVTATDPLLEGLTLSTPLLQGRLAKTGTRKAVPPHIAPAAVWRLCSTHIGEILGPALNDHYSAGKVAAIQGDWKDTSVVWQPKPNKKPVGVASMRPIGLQSPATTAFASALKVTVMEHLLPILTELPQYAYTPSRGTMDAIIRVHWHFEQVEQILATNRMNRFQRRTGKRCLECRGGSPSPSISRVPSMECTGPRYITLCCSMVYRVLQWTLYTAFITTLATTLR